MSHLEAAWAQKEKFIQSSRMILKFRDDHISQLKRELQTGQRSDPDQQNQQLLEEIRLLREQVDTLGVNHISLSCVPIAWVLVMFYLVREMRDCCANQQCNVSVEK